MFELQIDSFANTFIVLPGLNCRWPLFESLSSYCFIPLADGEIVKGRFHFSGICPLHCLDHRLGNEGHPAETWQAFFTSESGSNCGLALTFGEKLQDVFDKGPVCCSWRVWEDCPSSELPSFFQKLTPV